MGQTKSFKIFEDEVGTPGAMPESTKTFLKNQLSYWQGVEKTATDPKIQQKATDKVNAIIILLDRY